MIEHSKNISGKKVSHTNKPAHSKVKKEPQDSVLIDPFIGQDDSVIITYPQEKIEAAKERMEEEGFKFDDKGLAPSIIYSAGENTLCNAEKAVMLMGGKITGSLWLLNAFTADLSPEAYCYFLEKMPTYAPCPDRHYESLVKPRNHKAFETLANFSLDDLFQKED
ncbi:MAG TPA: hypothetical protein PL110_15025 [Candidatus Eremiobacteraeota bacterium]|nr:MAG: hypothetical protein BWY64_01903 [bacterium ADurb.Bin363]HPZ09416.1 hypothetical protein [Candidatus Eremiobacteraeota bacterium]